MVVSKKVFIFAVLNNTNMNKELFNKIKSQEDRCFSKAKEAALKIGCTNVKRAPAGAHYDMEFDYDGKTYKVELKWRNLEYYNKPTSRINRDKCYPSVKGNDCPDYLWEITKNEDEQFVVTMYRIRDIIKYGTLVTAHVRKVQCDSDSKMIDQEQYDFPRSIKTKVVYLLSAMQKWEQEVIKRNQERVRNNDFEITKTKTYVKPIQLTLF